MSEIRFNRWSHQSGTGGIYQDSSGNIGIGTSTPTSVLDIQGGSIKIGNDLLTSSGVSTFTSGLNVTGGSVGIGTDNPSSKVTVAADSATSQLELKRTNANTTGAIGALNFTALDGHSVANIYALGDGDNEGAHIVFKTTSAAGESDPFGANTFERLRITSSGLVGIGTDNPSSLLHCYKSGADTADIKLESGSGREYLLGSTGTGYGSADNFIIYDSTASSERLRIDSGGTVTVGYRATPGSTSTPARLSLSGDYSSSAGQNPKFDVWASSTDYMSLGVSSNQMDFMMSRDDYDYVWYGRNDADNGPEERMRIDNGEKTLDFPSSAKIRLQGSQNHGQRLAHINIGSDGGSSTDTRAIDIWGNWQNQESKSITYNHGSTTTNMVAQQRVRYNSTPSSTYYEIGRFYHGQDTSAYPIRFVSTSTTTANLELDGNLIVPSGYGIDFSATSGPGSGTGTSELFDDYEEGTWTPVFSNGGTCSYSYQIGHYTKIGNLVQVTVHLDINGVGTASGDLKVQGFPFTSANNYAEYASSSSVHGTGWTTARRSINILLAQNTTITNPLYHNMTGTTSSSNPSITGSDWGKVSHADMGIGNLLFTMTYRAA